MGLFPAGDPHAARSASSAEGAGAQTGTLRHPRQRGMADADWRAVVRMIVDTYFAPNKTFPELQVLMNSDAIDPLRAFSEECRAKLQALKAF
jgi:hypothetical protein